MDNLSAFDCLRKKDSNTKKSHKNERCSFHVLTDLELFVELTVAEAR